MIYKKRRAEIVNIMNAGIWLRMEYNLNIQSESKRKVWEENSEDCIKMPNSS